MKSSELFQTTFDALPKSERFVPGRVNLIGEHTDYNGGAVLPMALSLGVSVSLSPRSDEIARIVSNGFDGVAERNVNDSATGHWSDYAVGALRAARDEGWLSGGVDMAATSNLPVGAGLSSSAAFLVNVLKQLRDLGGASADNVQIARLARRVETDFIGMPCGIMDQMAVALAEPGAALFLDTQTLDYTLRDVPSDPQIVVLHSGVHRRLSDGHYKVRAEECDAVKVALGRDDICLVPLSALDDLSDPILIRRLRHCITEHDRTVEAAALLESKDFTTFGKLMVESHASMRDDFEITTPAIDALVETCLSEGALGARMTGGGFGGCIVALVPSDIRESWQSHVLAQYEEAYHVG